MLIRNQYIVVSMIYIGYGFHYIVNLGDHVKFGLPMAYSVTMLAWSIVDYRKKIADLNQMGNTLAAIKWGTSYFIKAHTQPNVLWAQMENLITIVDMTTPRTAYKLDPSHPCSDLAGEAAAALAAASLAFKPYDSSYSTLLLVHAKQLFSFGDTFRGLYDDSIPKAQAFYTSSGYSDELLWAAAWLYQATKDKHYLKYVVDNAVSLGGTGWAVREFSWDNKSAGVQILLTKSLLDGAGGSYTPTLKQYQAKADYFTCACLQKNDGYNVALTPGGLIYVREWNNLQYASSAAFLLAMYSNYLSEKKVVLTCPEGQVHPSEVLSFAKSQADYILGKNPKAISYLVGYGQNYPIQVHHRGASIAPISVLHTWYCRPQANPNIIHGALVGGPSKTDDFSDDRSNYEQTEPTLSGSAPLIGLFCKLQSLSGYPGSYHHKSPTAYQKPPASYHPQPSTPNKKAPGSSNPYYKAPGALVMFLHSIISTWTIGPTTYYKHKVVVKNTSQNPIIDLKLIVENLSGSLWGLSPCPQKNTYELRHWIKILKPGSEFTFVYVQGGAQAKVSIKSYH
ncbi:unnamed protein product [Withania somnifera]